MTVGMSKARITEAMSQREPKVRVAGSAVKNKPTTNTAMKAGQRGSGLVRCTSSSIVSLLTPNKTTAQRTPPVAVARRHFICFRRPFAAGRVVGELRRLLIRPRLQDGSDQSPLIFDLIAPDEERRVALHHVQQERLVSGRQMRSERRPVTEIQVN